MHCGERRRTPSGVLSHAEVPEALATRFQGLFVRRTHPRRATTAPRPGQRTALRGQVAPERTSAAATIGWCRFERLLRPDSLGHTQHELVGPPEHHWRAVEGDEARLCATERFESHTDPGRPLRQCRGGEEQVQEGRRIR